MLNSPYPSISGGGLTGKYNLYKVTVHWGALSTSGSEHTLDSSAYPLEVINQFNQSNFRFLNVAFDFVKI